MVALVVAAFLPAPTASLQPAPAAGASEPPGLAPPADLPAGGPRAAYERRLGAPPAVVQPPGRLGRAWRGEPTYVVGTSRLSRGELVYTDSPFDDTGADRTPDTEAAGAQPVYRGLCGNTGAYRHGEQTYPADTEHLGNAADLVEWRLAADRGSYYTSFGLQTLVAARTTAVSLRIDADGRPGFEHVLDVRGVGSDGVAATLDGRPVPASVDLAANTFEASFPRKAVPGRHWRVAVSAGLPDGTTTDLAFVQEQLTGSFNCWLDAAQSRAIAAGEQPAIPVDTDALRRGASDRPSVQRGAMVRLQSPSIRIGEGIVTQPKYGGTTSVYRGTLQPYATYVPTTYDPSRPNPLLMLLHCLNCNHNTFQIAAWPGLQQLAEERGAIVVTPLAYGEGGHYEEEAEWDVFDVLADVSARYRIDRERLYLGGMSMGALGSFRLGLLYPDLWAGVVSIGNYTNPNCVTPSQALGLGCTAPVNYFSVLENARNLPWGLVNGALDELTPVTGAREIADRLQALGYGYRYWELATRRHEPSLPGETAPLTSPWLGDRRRLADPARVDFVLDPDMDDPAWGLRHDRAYWVRDVRLAAGAAEGRVAATSGRGVELRTEPVTASGTSSAGPYSMRGLDDRLVRVDRGNRLALRLRGVQSLTVRLADAGLDAGSPLTLDVDTDRPVRITLAGRSRPVELGAGTHRLVLRP